MSQRGGGCCIARYAGGAYDYNNYNNSTSNYSKVNRIMLRFRPIAPKPTTTTTTTTPENSDSPNSVRSSTGRGKRKHASKDTTTTTTSVNKRSCSGSSRKIMKSISSHHDENSNSSGTRSDHSDDAEKSHVKTLSFLPETPGVIKESSKKGFPLWLSFEDGGHVISPGNGHVSFNKRMIIVESWVKVECVTETWPVYGSYGLGARLTDEERVRNLDADTCPGFVSDGVNRVRWTNGAYKRMVGAEEEVRAWLVVEEGVALPLGCTGFTCRVRIVTCGKAKNCKTAVPCDVWRMECGGFAWRLDTAAALSLGR